MPAAQLQPLGEGRFTVSGELDATSVTQLLKVSESQFDGKQPLEIDLAGVKGSDSTGLALLIEWLRQARRRNQSIRFQNVPQQIAALATISEVSELLVSGAN